MAETKTITNITLRQQNPYNSSYCDYHFFAEPGGFDSVTAYIPCTNDLVAIAKAIGIEYGWNVIYNGITYCNPSDYVCSGSQCSVFGIAMSII